jgi:methenyltetrahydromethanopterin cyclohydrolase
MTDTHHISATLSVNAHAQPVLDRLLAQADVLGLAIQRDDSGATIVDAGISARGSVEAGLLIGELCMAGLGRVRLRGGKPSGWPTWVQVASAQPVHACLASQYAGWSLAASKEETGGKKFFALGSGPVRALAAKEALFAELGYRDQVDAAMHAALVLEVDRVPPPVVIDKVLRDTGLAASQLVIVLTPTTSRAGTTQVVARVLEVALHKAHELKFPLAAIVEGNGGAPLPPPSPDGVEAMGRTNDAILYGGRVQLMVDADDDAARQLAAQLPARHSKDYGKPFAEIFRAVNFDFYQIDPALFAPAEVWVSSLRSGRTWHGGGTDLALLTSQWMWAA